MKHLSRIYAQQETERRHNPVQSSMALEDLKITEEGIVDSIKNVITGWREKRQDKRAEEASKISEIEKVIKELQKDLSNAKKTYTASNVQQTVEVDISGVSGWFIDHESKQVPKDLIARIEKDTKQINTDTEKTKKGHLDLAALSVDIYRHLDYKTDAGFTKTFIKRLSEVRKKSAMGLFPPGQYSMYLGNVGAGTKNILGELDKLDDVQWAAGVFRIGDRAMCTGVAKARGPDDKRTFTRSEVEKMIRICEDAIAQTADHYSQIGNNFNVDNTVFDWQVRAFYLQKEDIGFDGKSVELDLPNTLKVLRDLIQFPAVMTNDLLGLYLGVLEHRYDTARYYTQLLRRMVAGLK